MLGTGMNLVTTVVGFGMSATFIVFVCARLICGRVRSADSHAATFDIELRSDLDAVNSFFGQRERTMGGLESIVVASIPTMKYNKEAFPSKVDAQCSICLGEYQEKEMLRIMPTCSHYFHLVCIDIWLQKQSTCPICRLPLNDYSFEAKHTNSPSFGIIQRMRGDAIHSDHSRQQLSPGNHHLSDNEGSQEIHESLSLTVESPL